MSKAVLPKEEAERVAVAYKPRKFPQIVTAEAKKFVSVQSQMDKQNFHIERIVAVQTGISELERLTLQEKVEREALEKVKQLQESAYREAYQIGLDEGRAQAFNEHKQEIESHITSLKELLVSIEKMKLDLAQANEGHLIKLLYHMASRIAGQEIEERPDIILSVLKNAIESSQGDESIKVKVAKSDYEFIQSVKDSLGRDMDLIKRVSLEEGEGIAPGGCVVETNFGVVDASLETRVHRLWQALVEKIPRVKSVGGG